ncbi:helicase c-terminal domain-containing protein [Stylonychia lemnae]|uniref:Helicase c-terminal domain-containing protein n=1 Tax=Stylonychia lemnae TaxID=5949 RepID=A0A077ZNV2_STYLE|nr:helicase c-terminal domain-containing protein [Stylonychia lemnae]|eukprot:CDW71642.1 helicase c-terminal domain-containing protein [Stylonychia lemnae]
MEKYLITANKRRSSTQNRLSTDQNELKSPERRQKRMSAIEIQQEKTELKNLLKERYNIPQNSGTLPQANYNSENLSTWVYPVSKTFRTYQFRIVRSSLFANTIVTLPTGLGKTFIASTVMYNYYRWFQDGLIFFLAPTRPLVTQQVEAFTSVITEDIEDNILDSSKIVLLVIDEAHRASGNYSYCKIIEYLEALNVGFRIVSLSATPVSKIENLQTVVNSLRCAMLEVRDEEDDEIKQYTHDKDIVEIIVEKENQIQELELKIMKLMGKDKPLGTFVKNVKETDEYQEVVNYMEETKMNANHPKLRKLSEILETFFLDESHVNSKVIIFSQFRESANEIKRYLEKKNPDTVKAEVFVGQNNHGLSQKVQAAMINRFKSGKTNTLVATCVAEEGLDIGNVDLIISYDCLASPIRMIQRFGRTGRAGNGQVIVLIAKGEEENKFKMSKKQSKMIMNAIKEQSLIISNLNQGQQNNKQGSGSKQTKLSFGQAELIMPALQELEKPKECGLQLYSFNPRMIPEDIDPKPVLRKLIPRSIEEIEQFEQLNTKKRKSPLKKEKIEKPKKEKKIKESKEGENKQPRKKRSKTVTAEYNADIKQYLSNSIYESKSRDKQSQQSNDQMNEPVMSTSLRDYNNIRSEEDKQQDYENDGLDDYDFPDQELTELNNIVQQSEGPEEANINKTLQQLENYYNRNESNQNITISASFLSRSSGQVKFLQQEEQKIIKEDKQSGQLEEIIMNQNAEQNFEDEKFEEGLKQFELSEESKDLENFLDDLGASFLSDLKSSVESIISKKSTASSKIRKSYKGMHEPDTLYETESRKSRQKRLNLS